MKYLSEVNGKIYDSEAELLKAEKEIADRKAKEAEEKAKKEATRKERAAEIEKAIQELAEAEEKANKLIREFVEDYGSFHYSIRTKDTDKNLFKAKYLGLFNPIF